MIENAHIKIKVTGSPDKVAAFHWVVGKLDPDYPVAPPKLRRFPFRPCMCQLCEGLIWRTPMLSPLQLRSIGKQINDNNKFKGHLKVKVLMFNVGCKGRPVGKDLV